MIPGDREDTLGQGLEPGDRFEIHPAESGDRLTLPGALGPGGFAIEQLEDPAGNILGLTRAPKGQGLIVPELSRWLPSPDATIWLEYQAPGRFRLLIEPGSAAADPGGLTTEQGVRVTLDPNDEGIVRGGRPTSRSSTWR